MTIRKLSEPTPRSPLPTEGGINQDLTEEEKTEGMYLAIVKGLTCNGVHDWQKVTLKNGKEMAIRVSGSMVNAL